MNLPKREEIIDELNRVLLKLEVLSSQIDSFTSEDANKARRHISAAHSDVEEALECFARGSYESGH